MDALNESINKMLALNVKEYAIFSHGNILAEFTYLKLNDNRNIKTRIDTTFPNSLGIRVVVSVNEEIEFRLLDYIGGDR